MLTGPFAASPIVRSGWLSAGAGRDEAPLRRSRDSPGRVCTLRSSAGLYEPKTRGGRLCEAPDGRLYDLQYHRPMLNRAKPELLAGLASSGGRRRLACIEVVPVQDRVERKHKRSLRL